MSEDNLSEILNTIAEAIKLVAQPKIDASVFEPLIKYFQSLPKNITDSEEFKKADDIDASTRYEDTQWITSDNISYVNAECPEFYIQECFDTSTVVSKYIQNIVMNNSICERESIVVILSVFESYLHSKTEFNHCEGIKKEFRRAVTNDGKYSGETFALAVTYAIVKIIYANTSGNQFDKRLPHRNDILHNGTLSYSDDEIKTAYKTLLSYICIIDELFGKIA